MAIARLSMKVGKRGKAASHAAYISRIGQYVRYLERGEKLEATECGNMPAWAQFNSLEFWQAADCYERENGTTYREMEISLPRELSTEQQVALVREWVHQEIGERHAYQWGLHGKTAADGGSQPHVHLMFSERQHDNIRRDPELYFKRYNSKIPEKGGARKGYGANAGQTLAKAQRANELRALRGRWAELCNAHLAKAGHAASIDMRSYVNQGLTREPEQKQLPSQWRGRGRASVIEFRQARVALAEASLALAHVMPDIEREVKAQQEAATAQQRKQARQERIEECPAQEPPAVRNTPHKRFDDLVALQAALDRERKCLNFMPTGLITETGRKARNTFRQAKDVCERLERQRFATTQAQKRWRKRHPVLARIGWRNREAWDLEYALEALLKQQTAAAKSLQIAERAWLAAYEAETAVWEQENEARRLRIQAMLSELDQLNPIPQPEQAAVSELLSQDDVCDYPNP